MRRLTELLRGLLAATVLAAAVVGIPLLLIRTVGWPLPTDLPTTTGIADALTGRSGLETATIVKTLAVVVWLGWLQFTWSVSIEFVAAFQGRVVHPRTGFHLSHSLAVTLVSAVIVLAPAGARLNGPDTTGPAFNRPTERPQAITIAYTPPPAPAGPIAEGPVVADPSAAAAPSEPEGVTYTVVHGDTLWGLAERFYGDGFACTRIFDANLGAPQAANGQLRIPSLIEPGWTLTIPGPFPTPPESPETEAPAPEIDQADVTPLSPVDANTDPVAVPAPAPVPAPEPNADAPAEPAASAPSDPAVEAPAESVVLAPAAPAAEAPAPIELPTTTPTSVEDAPVITDPAPEGSAEPSPASADLGTDESILPALAPEIMGITGSTVLASGLLLALRRSRRRSAAKGIRRRTRTTPLERAIIAAADVPLIRWAGHELAELFAHLDADTINGAPVAVELSEATGIELLWDTPNPHVAGPWEATDGGWAWRLAYDPDEPVPDADRPCPIAGLVTMGQRDGRQVLLDLETYGSLAVTGDPAATEAFARSVVLELGGNDDLADAYVTTIGIDVDGTEQLPRVTASDVTTTTDHLRSTVHAIEAALTDADEPTTFTYRLGTQGTPLEVAVAVIKPDDDHTTSELVDAVQAHRGVAAIVVGNIPAAATLDIRPDGSARLEPLGLDLQAAGVPRQVAAGIAVLLDDPDETPTRSSLLNDSEHLVEQLRLLTLTDDADLDDHDDGWGDDNEWADLDVPENATAALSSTIDLRTSVTPPELFPTDEPDDLHDEWTPPEPRLLVQVLGPPAVPDRPGLAAREIIVTTYLACTGRPVGLDAIQDAVWGGAPVAAKTVYNLVGKTRSALGDLDGGDNVLPPIKRPEHTVHLAAGVWTDYALFKLLYERAIDEPSLRAMDLMRSALDLVQGPPFAADGYDWAYVGQYVADAEALIESAAEHLVDLALDANDIDLARYAVSQGLKALPANEVLYRARMRIEDAAGNPTAVRSAYNELLVALADLQAEPSDVTAGLYEGLTRRTASR